MVVSARTKTTTSTSKIRTRKTSTGSGAEKKRVVSVRRRKGFNLSRKEILASKQEKFHVKQAEYKAKAKSLKLAARSAAVRQQHKKSNRSFDSVELKCVQEGLVETITALGEPVTPLALVATAMTAISRTTSKVPVPYLLSIIGAAIPHLRQPVLLNQSRAILTMLNQVIQEQHQDNLILSKAMKCAQELFLAIEVPNEQSMSLLKMVEPSKLHAVLMPQYLTLFRKVLQQCAQRKYTSVFLTHLPTFVSLCTSMFSGAPGSTIIAAATELTTLVKKTFSPQIVEEGHHVLNVIVKESIVELFKPHYREQWPRACSIVEVYFSHLSFLKRTTVAGGGAMSGSARFLAWFPSAKFLLQVLNKIRHVEDTQLNSSVERSIAAIGLGMSVRDFVHILPFDPRRWGDVHTSDLDAFWKNSYTFNVIRRIASHDDLTFFREYFLPIAKYAEEMAKEATMAQRLTEVAQWNALWLQSWRICVGFFHYPVIVTDDSFRDIAKALVALLTTQLVDTAATAFDAIATTYYRLSRAVAQTESDDEADHDKTGKPAEQDHTKETLDENDAYLSMYDDGWNTHVYHNISQQEAERVCTSILSRYSSNIMPRLCNIYETHESTALLGAISSFAQVSSTSVMNSIVKGILDVGLAIQSEEEHYISPKRRMILSIAFAVVPQLSNEHLEALLTSLIEPVLSDPSPTSRLLQKKAYKLLYAMFEHRIKDIFPHFNRVMQLLVVSQQHVTVSGVKMRLKCLSWAIDACKIYRPELLMDAVKTCLGEVVLCAREQNSEAREMAMEVLEKMQRYITANNQHSHSVLLQMVLSGLSGQTGLLMSSTIVCLAKLVWVSHQHLTIRELKSVVSIGARLLESSITEVRSAAANFARMIFNLSKRSESVATATRECLPQITQAIALTTSQPRVSSSTRVMMRVLLEKCIKRFSFEEVEKVFPMGSKKFLLYTNKVLRREERHHVKELEEKNEQVRDEFKDLFLGAMKAGSSRDEDDTADLLQQGALANFVAQRSALPFAGKNGDSDSDYDDDRDDMCLTFESDGKIRILSKIEKKKEDEERKRRALAEKLLRKNKNAITAASFDERPAKRGRDEGTERHRRGREDVDDVEDEDVANDELILRYGSSTDAEATKSRTAQFSGSGGASLKLHDEKRGLREAKRQRLEQDIRKGDEYATGRGEGDVKRGKIDPFAYVPLNRRFINRRHRRQAVQRFDAVNYKVLKGNKSRSFGVKANKAKH